MIRYALCIAIVWRSPGRLGANRCSTFTHAQHQQGQRWLRRHAHGCWLRQRQRRRHWYHHKQLRTEGACKDCCSQGRCPWRSWCAWDWHLEKERCCSDNQTLGGRRCLVEYEWGGSHQDTATGTPWCWGKLEAFGYRQAVCFLAFETGMARCMHVHSRINWLALLRGSERLHTAVPRNRLWMQSGVSSNHGQTTSHAWQCMAYMRICSASFFCVALDCFLGRKQYHADADNCTSSCSPVGCIHEHRHNQMAMYTWLFAQAHWNGHVHRHSQYAKANHQGARTNKYKCAHIYTHTYTHTHPPEYHAS